MHGNGAVTSYGYDAVSRLAGLSDNLAGTGADQSVTFGYNPAGQIVTRTGSNDSYAWTGHGSGSIGSDANGLNQIGNIFGGTAAHDARGNMTFDPVTGRSYTYGAQNELKSSGTFGLAYDALGRLADTNVSAGSWKQFYYDGVQAAALQEPGLGITQRYVWGDGPDELIAWYDGSGSTNRRWAHQDERGSIVAISDANDNISINRYDEYGRPQSGNTGRFQYTGQLWLPEAGLYHYKARAYAPHLGRFMQTDPIGYDDGVNLYAYVGNDPIGRIDINGKRWLTNGERLMLEKYFGSGMLDYVRRIEDPFFGIIQRKFIDIGRSHIGPTNIVFESSDYRSDYSRYDETRSSYKNVFIHEFYHHFEIAIGISSFGRMAIDQARSQITGENLYKYDTNKTFLQNTPEARADAFARCVTYSDCSDIGNQMIPIDGLTGFKITPGGITFYAIVTGSRIPRPVSYPIKTK